MRSASTASTSRVSSTAHYQPSLVNATRLAYHLKVSLGWLCGLESEPPPKLRKLHHLRNITKGVEGIARALVHDSVMQESVEHYEPLDVTTRGELQALGAQGEHEVDRIGCESK